MKQDETIIPEDIRHYADPNDFNRVIYHQKSTEEDARMLVLLKDADKLIDLCAGKYENVSEYELFIRCMSEQTVKETASSRRLRTKEDGGM